jgi:hypothetical protein
MSLERFRQRIGWIVVAHECTADAAEQNQPDSTVPYFLIETHGLARIVGSQRTAGVRTQPQTL